MLYIEIILYIMCQTGTLLSFLHTHDKRSKGSHINVRRSWKMPWLWCFRLTVCGPLINLCFMHHLFFLPCQWSLWVRGWTFPLVKQWFPAVWLRFHSVLLMRFYNLCRETIWQVIIYLSIFTFFSAGLAEVCDTVTVNKTVTETCSAEVQSPSSSSNYTNVPDMLMKPQALTHYFLAAVACSPGL